MNGYKSKSESIKQLIQENNIDILLLTETKVYSKTAVRIEGYQVFPAVRSKGNGGGLLVAVKHGLCSGLMIDHGENAEFITVRLIFATKKNHLILAYGPQETDLKQTIDDFYNQIDIQVNRAILSGDSVVLAGDFNTTLGKEHIPGDIHNTSQNGRLLLNTLKTYYLVVLNSLRCCKGVFTRIKNTNADEKSMLDYVCTTNDLSKLVKDITIDEEKINTPWRSLRNGKSTQITVRFQLK